MPTRLVLAAAFLAATAAARPADAVKALAPAELDQALLAEVKANSEVAKNLQHLSDVIGPRLTGSKQLERANNWTADIMKKYGLENVKLEPWEMPYGWQRGTASLKVVEPDTQVNCVVAAWGWTPGTKGKVTGPVVVLNVTTRADLDKYKGKLKNAVIMTRAPDKVAPVTDLNYGPLPPPAKKAEPKEEKKATLGAVFAQAQPEKKKEAQPEKKEVQPEKKEVQPEKKEVQPEKKEVQPEKKEEQPKRSTLTEDVEAFLVAEGAACRLQDSGKPHGLLAVSGNWKGTDRVPSPNIMPRLTVAHEYYAMLWRLATRPGQEVTRVEVEITNTLIPGPVECYNTVGEVKGSEKPDEFVVVGAHLDSWDLATGTMDNGTGTCSVLETARVVAALAKKGYPPKRTIRFALFTGEEQGLWGSRKYVERHKDEMAKTSIALVHDTGTGKVYGFGVHGQAKVKEILERELVTVAAGEGWKGIDMGGVFGSDHQAFHPAGVPGLACRQDIDEYRLTHHTQTDTFDHAKPANLSQAAGVLAVTATRVANLPELLPRMATFARPKKD